MNNLIRKFMRLTKKIAYKVVTKDRKSMISVLPFHRKEYFSPFILTYRKNSIVEAPKGTQGIVLFQNISDAKDWIFHIKLLSNLSNTNFRILEVQLLSPVQRNFYAFGYHELYKVFRQIESGVAIEYKKDLESWNGVNVICCHKIKVLD